MGMGANFHVLKDVLYAEVREKFDHRHLNDIPPFDHVAPTAENLAREAFRLLRGAFDPGPGGYLSRVEVWESPETCAVYEEPRG
jgi:6-pyruvoyltetrahydropterin/6-carboxytetrahydropterin synthase